jgi:SAM-dependent methyltransferase
MTGRCIACGGSSLKPIYAGLFQCQHCKHAAAPSGVHLQELYTADYFLGGEYRNYLDDKKVLQRNFRNRLRVLDRFLTTDHQKLLEIGCAYGFFLELAKDRFRYATGVDVASSALRHARANGLSVFHGNLLESDLLGYDVACLWDNIEHLERPDLYVEKIATGMTSGGLIAITTGDFGSLNARMRGTRWRLLHPPSHAHYFTMDSMRAMLDRFGFDTVYASHCGYWRSLRSMAHGLGLPQWIGRGSLYLNLYDIMYVIGRKR